MVKMVGTVRMDGSTSWAGWAGREVLRFMMMLGSGRWLPVVFHVSNVPSGRAEVHNHAMVGMVNP